MWNVGVGQWSDCSYRVNEAEQECCIMHRPQQHRNVLHCKKLEVDLTLKRSSQLQSGFIQVQVVLHLLLQGFSVTTLVHWRCLANSELGCKMKSFCNCIFVPKRRATLTIFMYYWIGWTLKTIHALAIDYPLGSICVLLCKYSCHIGTLSTQRL